MKYQLIKRTHLNSLIKENNEAIESEQCGNLNFLEIKTSFSSEISAKPPSQNLPH